MVSESPPFWWHKADWRAWALSPVSLLYGLVAGRRMLKGASRAVDCPVICVGNFTVGGAGKTPTVEALAEAALAKGLVPGILSRGYGGTIDRTTLVDPDHHRARDVGDEPLILARTAMTVIARRRHEGAALLVEKGANLIIMDDGFQSARLVQDYALLVVDSFRGIGNGHIVPGGPVRAPIKVQLSRASALLRVGNGDRADRFVRAAARGGKAVLEAHVEPVDTDGLAGRRVLMVAGIADPEKFARTLKDLGAEIVKRKTYPDHHHFSDDEIADILSVAERDDLTIVMTEKDHVRLGGHHGAAESLKQSARVVRIRMAFDDPQAPARIIAEAQEAWRRRRLKSG